jgi:hypothetical protein
VFFKGVVDPFDGSLLCLLPNREQVDLDKALEHLNSPAFLVEFRFAGRTKLGQKSLAECHIPTAFSSISSKNT